MTITYHPAADAVWVPATRYLELQAERDRLRARLRKWEEWQPEDGALAELKAQADNYRGGAAQVAYINALEFHLQHVEQGAARLLGLLGRAHPYVWDTKLSLEIDTALSTPPAELPVVNMDVLDPSDDGLR